MSLIQLPPKIFQTEEDLHRQVRPVLELLTQKQYGEARILANEMLREGIPKTRINNIAYNYVQELINNKLQEAELLISQFTGHPFYWNCWLPRQPQLTLKNHKHTTTYG
jgi:hypothetical protein